ncbi:MAG: GNAT family N-acetyltransferase [Planctomycetota bacterium]
MTFEKQLPRGLRIVSTSGEHFEPLAALQRVVFPTLAEAELFTAEQYRQHVELFPEGQFAAIDGDRVVGMTSTIRYAFDFERPDHTFEEVSDGGWLTSHQPDGGWLYGMDIGVDPACRGRGIARALYAARQDLVRRLGLAGQVTVGLMNGYNAVADRMTPESYYAELAAGERDDPTVSAQRRIGFAPRGLVRGYVTDPRCGNCGVLLVLTASQDVPWPR